MGESHLFGNRRVNHNLGVTEARRSGFAWLMRVIVGYPNKNPRIRLA